jgi:hypothetical protein
MGDVIDYTEFRLGVSVWSLETLDDKPCDELLALCSLIHADSISESPVEMFPRTEPVILVSKVDPKIFVSINLTADPTDQMEVVGLSVRCKKEDADSIHELLNAIRARSEVKTALLRGNLGLIFS